MKKLIIIILSIMVAIVVAFDIYLVYRHYNPKEPPSLEVIPYEHLTLPTKPIECNLTKQEIKSLLDKFYRIRYTYGEFDSLSDDGYVNGNHIVIKSSLTKEEYLFALAHEITHIKYETSNETFVEYTTIIELYESGNELFKQVALNKTRMILSGSAMGTDYDCGAYLLTYFEGENLW